MSEQDRMAAGDWYSCLDDGLEALRQRARRAVHAHNTTAPDARGGMAPELAALFARIGRDVFVEAPFHCSYGMNIHLGDRVYLNAGCTVLDSGRVEIGDDVMIGPGVQIYCAEHHKDAAKRMTGQERAHPVSIGPGAWIGGRAIVMPGVRVGAGAIVGAGSVVTRDVAPGATVIGIPARAIG